ncbi:MAG: restriction endonuclease [archaeon]
MIKIIGFREHSKASEKYADVIFTYPDGSKWEGSIPIEYRRTGTFAKTKEEINRIINSAYEVMSPKNKDKFIKEQEVFWKDSKAEVTKPFFDGLLDSKWKCVSCELPQNPNWARRMQDIKQMGYTIATNTKMPCPKCKKNTTHLILVRLPRGQETGYETWTPKLRSKILKVSDNHDVYEDVKRPHLLPDHKFSEIRWDKNTKEDNPEDMTEEEIKKKFQLLNNQRNQQKREVCRMCFQTGKRGFPFGVKFFYEGDENWDKEIPKTGKDAERGCVGCGWYDLEKWREELNRKIN